MPIFDGRVVLPQTGIAMASQWHRILWTNACTKKGAAARMIGIAEFGKARESGVVDGLLIDYNSDL